MNDKELFEHILNIMATKYHYTIERPYNDNCVRIFNDCGELMGEFNYDGYNLLHNLNNLVETFKEELF